MTFALLLLLSPAIAGTTSGLGLSPTSQFGGVTEMGAYGVPFNPAATVGDGAGFDFTMEMGMLHWAVNARMEGQEPVVADGWMPHPSMAANYSFGRVGIGASMIMPYGGGGTFTEDGAARHFAINGMAVGADMALSIGFEPVEGLSLGYSHRGVFGIMSRRQAFDTATMMRSMFGDNIGVPAGDEFLEGRQEMSVTGLGTGYTLGGTWIAPNDVVISGAYRSKVAVPMSGRFTMEPSMDMTVVMEGDVTTEMVFPDEFVGGLEIPLSERWRIMAEGGYVRWSHTATMQAEMSNIEVTSSDDSLNELLLMYGVSELDLIAAGQSVAMVMGFQDAPWAKVAVEHDFTDKFTARAGATYSPTSIPTEYLNAGNQDYNTLDAMLAGKWQSSDSFAMTFGVDVYFDADRTVTDSVFSLENDMATGTALPDASGVYGLNRYRVAVGLHYKPSSR